MAQNPTVSEVQGEIISMLRENYPQLKRLPTVDESLFKSGTLDSMSFIVFLTFLEERFGIAIDISQLALEAFETIGRTADTVVEMMFAKDGGL